jgi:hypothetical protein
MQIVKDNVRRIDEYWRSLKTKKEEAEKSEKIAEEEREKSTSSTKKDR